MKIVADDKIPFLKGIFESVAEVEYLPGDQISSAALKTADALLVRSITKCNEALLKDTPVKFIATATIGDDHIDKDYCAINNIEWSSAKGCNSSAVEQYVLTALLKLSQFGKFKLKNKTLGIIGVGNIGARVAMVAELIGMKVLLNDPPRERSEKGHAFVPLQKIYEKADIITMHVPLTESGEDKTFHLVNYDFFNKLNKDIIFINTSRGAVVDSNALKLAISNGKVQHAVIDVWENEPETDQELLRMVKIATPHIAGYSHKGKALGTEMIVNAVIHFFKLECVSWKPDEASSSMMLAFDCSGLSDLEVLQRVFCQVYPILNDDKEFRLSPNAFEQLRRDYKYRKDNDSFNLDINGISASLKQVLIELGFKFLKLDVNFQNYN